LFQLIETVFAKSLTDIWMYVISHSIRNALAVVSHVVLVKRVREVGWYRHVTVFVRTSTQVSFFVDEICWMLESHAFMVSWLWVSDILACFLQNQGPAFVLWQFSFWFLSHALVDLRQLEWVWGFASAL
jgi:hypothetical protein